MVAFVDRKKPQTHFLNPVPTPDGAPAATTAALVSIHDVMPETMTRVCDIIRFLKRKQVHRLTLLVVPGKSWTFRQIDQLRSFQQDGIELAGHGWRHRVYRMNTVWHRLHGRLISRDEAEHLSLSESEIADIISRCYQWFVKMGLAPPTLYVPPAWAMGKLSRVHWQTLPFSLYETQSGVYDVYAASHYRMPVIGYMADTRSRVVSLKLVNAISLGLSSVQMRIAIHPNDMYLPLMSDLDRHLARFDHFLNYTDIFNGITAGVAPSHRRQASEHLYAEKRKTVHNPISKGSL